MAKGRRTAGKAAGARKVEEPLSDAGILPSGGSARIASISRLSVSSGSLAIVIVCGLVAAFLMYRNLSYGLPLYYHPDEPVKAMAAVNLARGTIPPRFYHPHFMLLFSAPFLYTGWALGIHPLLAARAAVATLGIATVGLLYGVGRYLAGPLAGAAAAILYATAPLIVVAAHDFKEDIPLAFWLTLQLLFLVRYLRHGRPRDLFLGAVAMGGAIGTKYTGLLAAPLLAGAVFAGPIADQRWRRLGIAAALVGVGFLVATPDILMHPGEFVADTVFEIRHALFGHGIKRVSQSGLELTSESLEHPITISPLPYLWTYHLRYSLIPGFSLAGILLAAGGVVVALTRTDRGPQLVAGAVVLFYLVLETLPLKPPPFAARYMVILLPYAALLGGVALAWAWTGGSLWRALVGLLFVFTIGLNGFVTVRQVEAMRPETRDQARDWILRTLPRDARLILPGTMWYTPFAGSFEAADFPFALTPVPESSLTELFGASRDPKTYLVVSSFNYQRYLDHPDFDPEATRFYRTLLERYAPLISFRAPYDPLGFHNPVIQVFHLSGAPPPADSRP